MPALQCTATTLESLRDSLQGCEEHVQRRMRVGGSGKRGGGLPLVAVGAKFYHLTKF